MQHVPLNSEAYRNIYTDMHAGWTHTISNTALFEEYIEPAVRDICNAIHASGLGVTRWSCEGHPEEPDSSGYIFIVPATRDNAMTLVDHFNVVHHSLAVKWGWEATLQIEFDNATLEGDITYPVITVRSPQFESEAQRNDWWIHVTKAFTEITQDAT